MPEILQLANKELIIVDKATNTMIPIHDTNIKRLTKEEYEALRAAGKTRADTVYFTMNEAGAPLVKQYMEALLKLNPASTTGATPMGFLTRIIWNNGLYDIPGADLAITMFSGTQNLLQGVAFDVAAHCEPYYSQGGSFSADDWAWLSFTCTLPSSEAAWDKYAFQVAFDPAGFGTSGDYSISVPVSLLSQDGQTLLSLCARVVYLPATGGLSIMVSNGSSAYSSIDIRGITGIRRVK